MRALWQLVIGVGALLAAFPPVGLWPLAILGPIALTRLGSEAGSSVRAFGRLWLAGLVFFGIGSGWVAETHIVNLVLVTLVQSFWFGVYGWLAHRVIGRGASPMWLGVIWVAHEMLRHEFPETGFPWQLVGQAAAASPLMVQVADLGGVMLVSWVLVTVSSGLLARWEGRPGLLPALLVLAAALAYGAIRPGTLAEPEPGPVLAAIQPGFPQRLKDNPAAGEERYAVCMELVRTVAAQDPPPDLIVWPETIWPLGLVTEETLEPVGQLLARSLAQVPGAGQPATVLGAAWGFRGPDGEAAMANSALYYDGAGRPVARYDKHMLVPGGEMIPWYQFMPEGAQRWLRRTVVQMAGFWPALEPGPGPNLVELDGLPFGVTICYENAYGSYCRGFVQQGARFLVNISNEAWFGGSTEYDHMELQSILRAVETRRAVFRSTNSGISCLARPDGRRPGPADRLVVDGLDRDVRGSFTARIPLHSDATLYVAWGDWPGWLCLLAAAWAALRRRGAPVSSSNPVS